jgi:MFS family permease
MADVTDTRSQADEPAPSGMLRETRDSLAAVFANRNLRRIELAFAGSAIGDWAYATAVAVWAYGEGGAKAVGIWMAIRYTLMAVSAPFGAALADRMPRKRLMIIADLSRAVLIAAAAACLFVDTPAAPIYVLATLSSLLGTPFMCAQRSMLPSLAERPEELTAANGTASTIESLAFFIGPALGALLLGFTTVQVVFLVNVVTFLWSMSMVAGVHAPARQEEDSPDGADHDAEQAVPGFLSETSAGFRTIGGDRGLLVVTIAASVQTLIAGASAVFVVVMAAEVLGTGARGVGFLDSVFGIGSILGGVVAISRASRGRLGSDLAVGVALWSLPLMLVTLWPSPATCFAAMVLLGLGNPLVDVSLDTIVQRLAPDEVLGRVFGALEACFISTMALGALVMPFLIDWLELRWALLAIAVPVGLTALLGLPEMRRLDTRLVSPAKLPLLRGIDIFAPLAPGALESLARGLTEIRFSAGDVLLREGEESDLFYVVESGVVEVTQAGRVLRREGPGEYFGEIGLLRDVPRTATITAVEDTVVQTMSRDDFLRAVSGQREARLAAENIVSRRLAV